MSASLALTVVLYAAALALWCTGCAIGNRPRPASFLVALGVLEAGLVGLALLDVLALLTGRHGSEVPTNLGYLITAVLVLPIAAGAVRLDTGRWGSLSLAVGCLLAIVISLRLQQTLHASAA